MIPTLEAALCLMQSVNVLSTQGLCDVLRWMADRDRPVITDNICILCFKVAK